MLINHISRSLFFPEKLYCCGVVVKTTAQLPSAKSELRLGESLNLACSVLEIGDGGNLWKSSQLEIRHKRLSLVIHSAETIHHCHHHYLHHHRYVLKIGSKSSHENMFLVTVMAYIRFWISVSNRVWIQSKPYIRICLARRKVMILEYVPYERIYCQT